MFGLTKKNMTGPATVTARVDQTVTISAANNGGYILRSEAYTPDGYESKMYIAQDAEEIAALLEGALA
jgi:hypothetical protein